MRVVGLQELIDWVICWRVKYDKSRDSIYVDNASNLAFLQSERPVILSIVLTGNNCEDHIKKIIHNSIEYGNSYA